MSLASGDLVFYGSANMPTASGTTTGGAIATTTLVVFNDATLANTPDGDGVIRALSSSASDNSQVLTITGRNAAGIIVTDTITMGGTVAHSGSVVFERLLRLHLDVAGSGTIAGRQSSNNKPITDIPAGITDVRRPFYDVAADATGGDNRIFYEKIFIKNTHATLALTNAQVTETSDPSGKLAFALENNKGGTQTTSSREVAPTGCSSFDSSAKNPENSYLNALETQSVWLQLTLNAGTAAAKTTYGLQIAGTST